MAETKNFFAGLVKITTSDYSKYVAQQASGKMVFAEVTGENASAGKYIWANGVEYKVADATNLDELIRKVGDISTRLDDLSTFIRAEVSDLSTYVYEVVDTSIEEISTRLSQVAITAADNSIYVNGTSIAVEGDDYVSLTTAGNKVSAALKESAIVKGTGTGAADVSLATKGYVDEQVAVLEQALVFKGEIEGTADASSKLTDADVQAGWTYVVTTAGAYNGETFEVGDLVIVKEDSPATEVADVIVVERNLDGAVTAAAALTDDYVILGSGNQTVKVSTIEVNALLTAIENANSAVQDVVANSSTPDYLQASAAVSSSTATVTVGVKVVDLSTAAAKGDGLADAYDVRQKLEEVEEVMATVNTKMANTLGMDSSYGVNWTNAEWAGYTYKEAIETAAAAAGVTEFGGATGAISIDTAGDATHNVVFGMDGSTLQGNVDLSSVEGDIADVSDRLNDLSTFIRAEVSDLSTHVYTVTDASVNTLETWKADTSFVNTLTGDDYVKANQGDGDVVLTTTIGDIATATEDASGLATAHDVSAFVYDQLAWAVISD